MERVIEQGIAEFLTAGKALAEVRSSRLYREHYPTFASYCRDRFALARSSVDGLIRSTQTAELLAAGGVSIPEGTPEAVVRPFSSLPGPELQIAVWKLVEVVSLGRITQPISSKVCRAIRNALEPEPENGTKGAANGKGLQPREREPLEREVPFVRPVQRLSAYPGFNAALVTSHIEKLPSAWNVHVACAEMIRRCRLVQEQLEARFPELA